MNISSINQQQRERMTDDSGFVAALDQSGGSTPKALAAYGVQEGSWANEDEMFAIVHQMRTRIITSPSFTGDKVLGAILFENTMDRNMEGRPSADYLWEVKRVVPLLKVDSGLAEEQNGVQLMKAMPDLPALLAKAKSKHIFGTKMRSLIKLANEGGIRDIVDQQFAVAAQILAAGLIPIIEPEVDIHCPEKARAEEMLHDALLRKLDHLSSGPMVFLKLTLPEQDDLYLDCAKHAAVGRVFALSGGYSQSEGDERLRRNHRMVASFSRALLDGLTAQQTEQKFNSTLAASIQSIYEASTVKIETYGGCADN